MKKYGELKQNIIAYLSESYNGGQFKEAFKKAVVPLLETKRFKEIYYLYGQIEESSFNGDQEIAEIFLNEAIQKIQENGQGLKLNIPAEITSVQGEANPIYEAIDTLVFSTSISEIEKRVKAKRSLVEHLKRSKKEDYSFAPVNEAILINLLSNQYNTMFGNIQEDDKKLLEGYLALPQEEVSQKVTELKEALTERLSTLITENNRNDDVAHKLHSVNKEVMNLDDSRYALYKLTKLQEDLS